jgi:hypothetical protein
MCGGLLNDWHSQGLALIGNAAFVAGAAHLAGAEIACGFMLGLALNIYIVMLARVQAERE